MLVRYASAVTTGTFVTFGLLFVMQLLISLQPGAKSEPRTRVPIDWIKPEIPESPVATRKEVVDKKKLTEAEVPPVRPRTTGGHQPLFVTTMGPAPPPPPPTRLSVYSRTVHWWH